MVDYPEQPPSAPEMSLDQLAFPRSGWALLYFDEIAVIYARRNGNNDEIIRQKEIRTVQPLQLSSYLDAIIKEPAKAQQFLEEMEVNLREHPSSFRARFLMGIFALKRGPEYLAEAVQEFQRTIALNPEYVPAYLNLGSIYMHLGRYSEARQLYEQVLARRKMRRPKNNWKFCAECVDRMFPDSRESGWFASEANLAPGDSRLNSVSPGLAEGVAANDPVGNGAVSVTSS